MPRILTADIGGTHSRFALFQAELHDTDLPLLRLEREQWLAGSEYPSFAEALTALSQEGKDGSPPLFGKGNAPPDIAVLAPAGPVEGDTCILSNLDWVVRGSDVSELYGIKPVVLINDFAAQAYACLMPWVLDIAEVIPGQSVPGAPIAVIGAGTGLGKAILLPDDEASQAEMASSRSRMLHLFSKARVLPTEGGHEEFPFVGKEEFAFAQFAAKRAGTDRLIGDNIVTGSGLAHIFAYHTGKSLSPPEATAQSTEHPVVLEWFARFYGRACRNFVLDTLARGGVYITGGMALRLPVLTHKAFIEEFHTSVAQRPLLEQVPIWHVRKSQAGLWGAALYGLLGLLKQSLS